MEPRTSWAEPSVLGECECECVCVGGGGLSCEDQWRISSVTLSKGVTTTLQPSLHQATDIQPLMVGTFP